MHKFWKIERLELLYLDKGIADLKGKDYLKTSVSNHIFIQHAIFSNWALGYENAFVANC